MAVINNAFAKTICTICYEDLKPNAEDLQAISVCGHVFHELCLQQWFEYCSNNKKNSCPVCKQACLKSNVGRLYFQSIGESNDPVLSQRLVHREGDPDALLREVKRLETKVVTLTSDLERQQKDLKQLLEEVRTGKEQAKKEASLKNEALNQKALLQQLLHSRTEELNRSTIECMRLQERNMSLAKELAALKLLSDLNLEEDEILKLASLGNEANNKDTIDVLRRSLVIRNVNYKELMAKCNQLGRGEARSVRKLEKAKEKITKLKTRLREMETAMEEKDNEVLRALKASRKSSRKKNVPGCVHCDSSFPQINSNPIDQIKRIDAPIIDVDQITSLSSGHHCSLKIDNNRNVSANITEDDRLTSNPRVDSFLSVDKYDSGTQRAIRHPSADFKHPISEITSAPNSGQLYREATSKNTDEIRLCNLGEYSGLETGIKDTSNNYVPELNEEADIDFDDIREVQPVFHVRKENPTESPISIPAEGCFSGGLLAPDGTSRHLGKWCKRIQNKGLEASSVSTGEGSVTGAGNLIAVGADGRGGKIKVLRSLHHPPDPKETTWAKRCKYGAKTSMLQNQGCLQIEHYFGRNKN